MALLYTMIIVVSFKVEVETAWFRTLGPPWQNEVRLFLHSSDTPTCSGSDAGHQQHLLLCRQMWALRGFVSFPTPRGHFHVAKPKNLGRTRLVSFWAHGTGAVAPWLGHCGGRADASDVDAWVQLSPRVPGRWTIHRIRGSSSNCSCHARDVAGQVDALFGAKRFPQLPHVAEPAEKTLQRSGQCQAHRWHSAGLRECGNWCRRPKKSCLLPMDVSKWLWDCWRTRCLGVDAH